MEEKKLLQYARRTIAEAIRILKMDSSGYIKNEGIEQGRVDKAKIEKCQTLLEALAFFMGEEETDNG